MNQSEAKVIREYGPFPGIDHIHGLTYDGRQVWFATGDKIVSLDPESGETTGSLDVPAHAGTAFDGRHLFQIYENRIQKVDPKTGKVLSTIPTPSSDGASGLAWAEGFLWVGQYRARKIHQVDPETGKVLRTIESDRFVTGVTWLDDDLWHATWENDQSEIRKVDAKTGQTMESLKMPAGTFVSGLESNGRDTFYCGGGNTGKIRAVQKAK